ncbi:MAG: ROK family protein [Spirochaetales bacterium]|nr:ROK family protein [Spirochaetales bacterium]
MPTALGSNLQKAKVANQVAIKRMTYFYGPITRLEITNALNLTLPTITTNVNSMIQAGIIRETDEKISQLGGAGRKSRPIEIVPQSRYFIGTEIKKKYRIAVLTDYKGNILAEEKNLAYIDDYEGVIEDAAALILNLLSTGSIDRHRILGIGVALPGIVDPERGILLNMLKWEWKNRNITEDISRLTGFEGKVSVENDAIARAISASLFDRKRLDNFKYYAYLYVSDGISCPLMNNSPDLVTRALGPGELGYTIIGSNLPEGKHGPMGTTSNLAGQRAILEAAAAAAEAGDCPELNSIMNTKKLTIDDLIQAQRNGSKAIGSILKKAVEYLGISIANVDNIFRPDCFLVECPYFKNDENRIAFIYELEKHLFRPDGQNIDIIFVDPSDATGAVGAAAVAIQRDLGEYIE